MWAPQKNLLGQTMWHWSTMKKVIPGDIVFCYVNKEFRAIGVIESRAAEAPKPNTIDNSPWEKEGWLVKMRYHNLSQTVAVGPLIPKIGHLFPKKYSPYSVTNNSGNQIYLAEISEELGTQLLELLEATDLLNPPKLPTERKEITELSSGAVSEEIPSETSDNLNISPSEKLGIIKQRLVQGEFRTNLMKKFNRRCALTSLDREDLLIASHIKPWSESNEMERRDVNNGLLLCSPIDSLFDKYYISFLNDGTLVISESLGLNAKKVFGITKGMRLTERPNLETQKYLLHHRGKLR